MGNTFSCPCPRGKLGEKLSPGPVSATSGQVVAKTNTEEKKTEEIEGTDSGAVQTKDGEAVKPRKPYRCLEVDVSDKNTNLFFRILFWASPDKLWWAGAYTSLCFNSIIGASQPKLFTDVVTSIKDPTSGAFIFAVSRLTAISFLLTATGVGNSVCFSEASFRLNMRLKKMVLCNVLQQEMGFFDSTTAGDLITQIGSTGGVCAVVNKMIPTALRGTLTVGTAFYFLSMIDVRLAMITFVSVPTELVLSYVYAKQFEKYSEEVQECNARTGTCIQETMHGIRAIRPLHAEERQSNKFMRLIGELRKLQLRQRRILAGQTVFSTILPHGTGLLILCYGAHLVLVGAVPATAIITVTMYQSTLQSSMGSLMSLYVDWRSMLGSTRKVIKYLDRIPEGKKRGSYVPPDKKLKGRIEVRNISFSYANNPKRKILSNISIDIAAGGRLALVGPSGGGKSSLINMMMGIYDPDEGEVLIDGIPISEYDPQFLYTKGMSSVYQTPTLFKCSVRENITFGMGEEEVKEEDIIAAAKAANAHDFIMQLSKGYDTDLGLDGSKLSGGQRQRIAIARAIVRNPSILLLDEPTSALDNRCEYAVKEALLNVMEGRTVIVVAHRLTTIQSFERIVVMEHGKFVEDGNHQELIDKGGLYFTLAAGIFAEEAQKRNLEKARSKVQK